MNKNKLNQPDVEQTTTTINVFEKGMPPTIVPDEYPVKNYKNYNLKNQEEQTILKEIEDLGYEVRKTESKMFLENDNKNTGIKIDLKQKAYGKYERNYYDLELITIEEHQLLHRLFEIWGWIDD